MKELLTPQEMGLVDQLTIDAGTSGYELMKNAGQVLFEAFSNGFPNTETVLIVCGIGNNGGDGFVLATKLQQSGNKVDVFIVGDEQSIGGDAKSALDDMPASVQKISKPDWHQYDVIVDALFGAGLSREVTGVYAETIKSINEAYAKVFSIDLPSGINGEAGQVMGCAVEADLTSTFFSMKPGHLLLPGRLHCGVVDVGQIGISDEVLSDIKPATFHNIPDLWRAELPMPQIGGHKYSRGHTLCVSGPLEKSGAIRLAAKSALRMGSGLVTIAADKEAMFRHGSGEDSLMLTAMNSAEDFSDILRDPRINSICVGPGRDPDEQTREIVLGALTHPAGVVLDAGGISSFSDIAESFYQHAIDRSGSLILTPHDGEFVRMFPNLCGIESKLERARAAAQKIGATIVLKGPDTVVAAADGRAAISDNGSPWLATAGSGDVLSGIIAGLLAQGMPEFEAACAGVWFHGEASQIVGAGLTASDLDWGLKAAMEIYYENAE